MAKNYYDILGVQKSASADDIKRAYRKLAHQYHPDKGNGNAEKFKQINEAYQVLGNEQKRQAYDQFGDNYEHAAGFGRGFGGEGPAAGWDFGNMGQGGFNMEFDLGDIFGDLFGARGERPSRRNRGIDLEMGLQLAFEEAVFGVEKTITLEKQDVCRTCSGSGAEPGSRVVVCPQCHGQGYMVTARRTIFGNVQSRTTCDKCQGQGKVPEQPCRACGGSGSLRQEKTLSVKIPAGIDNGQRIRVPGEGEAGYRGSQPGDLFLVLQVKPHREFARDGFRLLKNLPISFTQAALGAKIIVGTLDGDIELKIPAGTQSGTVFKVAGKGVPRLGSGGRGDLLVTVRVVVPQKLSKKEKELLKEIAKEQGEVYAVNEGFWESIRNSL